MRLLRKAASSEWHEWHNAISEQCEGPLELFGQRGRIRFYCTIGGESRFQNFAIEMTRDDVHACLELLEKQDNRK